LRILHFCAGLQGWNGMANTARQFVAEEVAAGHDSKLTDRLEEISNAKVGKEGQTCFAKIDVVHIHGAWLPVVHRVAKRAKEIGAKLIIRPAGSYDPVRRHFHGWKKLLMAPWEHAMLRRADVVQATCPQEAEWIREYLGGRKKGKGKREKCGGPRIEITDLKRFFDLGVEIRCRCRKDGEPLHVLYLGRRHPLKGVQYLEQAVQEINHESHELTRIELRVESNIFGEEKGKAWEWCDVLCLPTLSENFGRVVAESLEHGRPVITTDGAPAWEPPPEATEVEVKGQGQQWSDHLVYLRGYRDGSDAERVKLLKDALVGRTCSFWQLSAYH